MRASRRVPQASFVVALSLTIMLLVTGFPPTVASAQSSPITLRVSRTGFTDVANLNPYSPEGVYGIYIELYLPFAANTFASSAQVVPVLAKGWSHNSNYTQWVLNLREGLKWDNGSPLNATDLLYSIDQTNQTSNFGASSYSILNSTAVQVNFSAPDVHFVSVDLGSIGIEVVPAAVFSKVANLSAFADLQNVVADGPFVVYNYTEGTNPMVMKANPYFFLGAPKVQQVAVYLFSSFSSAVSTFDAGGVDALWTAAAYSTIKSLQSVPGTTLVQSVPASTQVVAMNDWQYPFNVTGFRQALAYATNTTQIVDLLNGPFASTSVVPYDMLLPAYNQELGFPAAGPTTYDYNLAKAQSMLSSLGFKTVGGTLEYSNGTAVSITLTENGGSPDALSAATLVQQQWQKLGIKVQVVSVSSSTESALIAGNTGWQADVTSGLPSIAGISNGPGLLTEEVYGYSVSNATGSTLSFNSTYDAAVANATQYASGSADYLKYASNAAKIFADSVPVIPLYSTSNWVAVSNSFTWGSQAAQTGIYNPQAVASQVLWYETLYLVSPLAVTTTTSSTSTSSTSSTSSTQSTSTSSSTTTSASSTTSVAAPAANYDLYYGVGGVAAVVVIAAAAYFLLRKPRTQNR